MTITSVGEISARVRRKAKLLAADKCTKGHRGAMVGALEALFPNDTSPVVRKAKRQALLRHFFGVDSSKELNAGQVLALLRWAQEFAGAGYKTRVEAVQEAATIIEARDVAAGQRSLSL